MVKLLFEISEKWLLREVAVVKRCSTVYAATVIE